MLGVNLTTHLAGTVVLCCAVICTPVRGYDSEEMFDLSDSTTEVATDSPRQSSLQNIATRTPEATVARPNGIRCSIPSQCESRFCEHGYCCDQLCGGLNQSCGAPSFEGTCVGIGGWPTPTVGVEGSSCVVDTECESTFCIDRVCCNSGCGGRNESCAVPGFLGTCVSVSALPTPTIHYVPSPSPQLTPTPNRVAGACSGDCDGNGTVTINEVISCVNVGLELLLRSACLKCDGDGDGAVSINEIVSAVNVGLGLFRPSDCGPGIPPPTPTSVPVPPTATGTIVPTPTTTVAPTPTRILQPSNPQILGIEVSPPLPGEGRPFTLIMEIEDLNQDVVSVCIEIEWIEQSPIDSVRETWFTECVAVSDFESGRFFYPTIVPFDLGIAYTGTQRVNVTVRDSLEARAGYPGFCFCIQRCRPFDWPLCRVGP